MVVSFSNRLLKKNRRKIEESVRVRQTDRQKGRKFREESEEQQNSWREIQEEKIVTRVRNLSVKLRQPAWPLPSSTVKKNSCTKCSNEIANIAFSQQNRLSMSRFKAKQLLYLYVICVGSLYSVVFWYMKIFGH